MFISCCSTNVVMNYTEVEAKVREATSDDAWGPHGTLMHEIAQYTFTYEHFPEVMGMLWKRMLHENRKNWRRVYKVGHVLEPIVLCISDTCPLVPFHKNLPVCCCYQCCCYQWKI